MMRLAAAMITRALQEVGEGSGDALVFMLTDGYDIMLQMLDMAIMPGYHAWLASLYGHPIGKGRRAQGQQEGVS
jgi:hypothetical protein